MKLSLKAKLLLIGAGLVACGLLGLQLYCKGKKAGVAEVRQVDLRKELYDLDEEKKAIRENVHALDTNALKHRILSLSDRLTTEVQASDK